MQKIKDIIKFILPEFLQGPIRKMKRKIKYSYENFLIKTQPRRHKKALENVKEKTKKGYKIKVAFFATHSSVWKYDGVYEILKNDERFDPIVVVCPVMKFGEENMKYEMSKSYSFFKKKGYNVIKTYDVSANNYLNVKKIISPDIIFYTNPIKNISHKKYYILNFKNTLTCYVQYLFSSANIMQDHYNSLLHNLVWRFYVETEMHKRFAQAFSRNNGRNTVVTGYPGVDRIKRDKKTSNELWECKDDNKIKIIWAPHHTIHSNGIINLSTFLHYYKYIPSLIKKFNNQIHIAFKPHPLLKPKLYEHPEWGQEKTDEYFKMWETTTGLQLNTDDYIDLFNSSDAIIFDSMSFTVEYLFTGKPSLFLVSNKEYINNFNDFGKEALKVHYKAFDKVDIDSFISEVILENNDYKKQERDIFYNRLLKVNDSKNASENIVDSILSDLSETGGSSE